MDLFKVPSPAERAEHLAGYVRFLRARNGVPDPIHRTLSRREAWFRALAARPVRSGRPLDGGAFHRNLRRAPVPGLDPRMLWLLGAIKVHISERYGVELALARNRRFGADVDEILRYVQLEELVHTRLLSHCCDVFDLEPGSMRPPVGMRVLINAIVRAPMALARPMALCAEIFGAAVFQVLRERVDVFGDEPEVAARLRELVEEILTDEMGHILFHRVGLGEAGARGARRLLPVIARSLVRDNAEVAILAGGAERLVERALWLEVDPAPFRAGGVREPVAPTPWAGGEAGVSPSRRDPAPRSPGSDPSR